MKKDKVITLRMSEKSYEVIKDFATSHNLNVNAYLNSIVDAYAQWFIPTSSYAGVNVPKRMLSVIFEMLKPEQLEELAKQWAIESKNIVLLSGNDMNLDSVLEFSKKVAKYFMGADARISRSNPDRDEGFITIAIRHEAGNNFSYFCAKTFENLFSLLHPKNISSQYDSTTLFLKIGLH